MCFEAICGLNNLLNEEDFHYLHTEGYEAETFFPKRTDRGRV